MCWRWQGLQVVWYGDDLVESWRGSSAGGPCPACDGVPSMWGKHFGSLYRAQAYGIAGVHPTRLNAFPSQFKRDLQKAATLSVFGPCILKLE